MDLDAAKDLRVLLVGDAIMDEYIYVKTVGKAMKDPALSCEVASREVFRGGVWATAEHVRNFVGHVDVWTGSTVNWSTRIVEDVYMRKLFTIHETKPQETCSLGDVWDYDLVIVCDYGYGSTRGADSIVARDAKFLAVNTQTNAMNYGFNVITKYQRADFVVLDELEARLAVHDKESPIEKVIEKLDYQNIIVTLGTNGAVGYNGKGFERRPAVARRVIDTMGAGDAFLAVTAPFAALGWPMSDLLRLGNAAGAAKCSVLGHRKSVDRDLLEAYLG